MIVNYGRLTKQRITVSAFAACCSGTLTASGDGSWKLSGSVCATRSTCTHMRSVMLLMII